MYFLHPNTKNRQEELLITLPPTLFPAFRYITIITMPWLLLMILDSPIILKNGRIDLTAIMVILACGKWVERSGDPLSLAGMG